MLVIRENSKIRLGERFPVRLCLRPSVLEQDGCVELSRGWLGLGGAPDHLGMGYLPGALQEISELQDALESHGIPVSVLLDEEATVARLTARLTELRPAVVHLAVHGHYDMEFPEACTLVLAPDPVSPCNELLPFRRILDLPLKGVELVILSACSSLIGVSGRSAGMEGLAWAFLQAGAGQVIASRKSVNDQVTRWVMRVLYRYLLQYPVAEALRLTRRDYLQEPDVDPQEIALWSVWS